MNKNPSYPPPVRLLMALCNLKPITMSMGATYTVRRRLRICDELETAPLFWTFCDLRIKLAYQKRNMSVVTVATITCSTSSRISWPINSMFL
jgi:hypothetical protein